MPDLEAYLQEHFEGFEAELCELLRIPSVSADSQYAKSMRKASQWVADQFQSLGFETETIETEGHPIVFAQSEKIPDRPTALVYGHYDVQPPDPVDQWRSPPWDLRMCPLFARLCRNRGKRRRSVDIGSR